MFLKILKKNSEILRIFKKIWRLTLKKGGQEITVPPIALEIPRKIENIAERVCKNAHIQLVTSDGIRCH